jgi:hypothetical protein
MAGGSLYSRLAIFFPLFRSSVFNFSSQPEIMVYTMAR